MGWGGASSIVRPNIHVAVAEHRSWWTGRSTCSRRWRQKMRRLVFSGTQGFPPARGPKHLTGTHLECDSYSFLVEWWLKPNFFFAFVFSSNQEKQEISRRGSSCCEPFCFTWAEWFPTWKVACSIRIPCWQEFSTEKCWWNSTYQWDAQTKIQDFPWLSQMFL